MIEFSEKGRSTILAGQWETWWCSYWWGEPPFCGWCTLWGTITYITPTPNIRRLIVLWSYSHPWGYHSLLNFWQISHSPLPIAGVFNQEGDQWLLQTNPAMCLIEDTYGMYQLLKEMIWHLFAYGLPSPVIL